MSNDNVIENGRRLFQSAENLRGASLDLDALMHSLWDLVSKATFAGGEIEDLGDEDSCDERWVTPAYAYNAVVLSIPERAKGQRGATKRPKKIGSLSMIVRLCNSMELDDMAPDWPWLDQACLILGWHPNEHAEDNWEIENFCPNDENQIYISHLGHGLWSWRYEDDDQNYAYFFVLPIFAIRDETDLNRLALRPLKTLFEAAVPSETAVEALRGLPVLLPRS
jgi:hypothetical protein